MSKEGTSIGSTMTFQHLEEKKKTFELYSGI
jgi:hypothetical protein